VLTRRSRVSKPGGENVALTEKRIRDMRPDTGTRIEWDDQLRGLGVRITAAGVKAYVLNYRVDGRERRMTLGRVAELSLAAARKLASEEKALVRKGIDPLGQRDARRNAPLMAELFDRYLSDHARPNKKPRSVKEDERLIRLHLSPAFGQRKVAEITRNEIDRWHKSMKATPGAANRGRALLSKALNLAEVWGWRPDGSNPVRHIKRFKESDGAERFLSLAELRALGEALRAYEADGGSPYAAAAIRLLALIGARKSEVLSLRWDYVDFEGARLNLPDSKTGKKAIPLNAAALAVLAALPRIAGNPHVFPGSKASGHISDLKWPWMLVRKGAGLGNVRLHDLRHSFASLGAGSGMGLPIIGALLGHKEARTTQRYAHLADDPLRAASEVIGGQVAAALGGEDAAGVVELKRQS
jgi:integrase